MNRSFSLDWSPGALSPTTTAIALQKNKTKIDRLKEELQVEINEKSELFDENNKLKRKLEELNKQIKAKHCENEKLKENIDELDSRIESLITSQLSDNESSTETNLLKLELDELKLYNATLDRENEEKRKTLKKYEQQIQFLEKELSLIEKSYGEVLDSCQEKDLERQKLLEGFRVLEEEIRDLKDSNQMLKEEISLLESQKGFHNSFNDVNKDCLKRELEFEMMKNEVELMASNIRTIEQEQVKLISNNTDLTEERTKLRILVESLTSDKCTVEKQSADLQKMLNSLGEECNTYKVENNRLYSKIDADKAEYEALVNDYKSLRENNATYLVLLKKSEADLRELEYEKENLEMKLENCNVDLDKLKKENTLIVENYGKLEKSNEHQLSSIEELNSRVSNLITEKSHLISNLHRLENTHNDLSNKYNSLYTENESKEKLYYVTVTELTNEKQRVEKLYENTKENLEQITDQMNSLQCRCEFMEKREAELVKAIEGKLTEICLMNQEISEFSSKYQNLNERYEHLEQTYDRCSKESNNLENQLQVPSSEKQSIENELSILNIEYKNLKNECSSVSHYCTSIVKTNEMKKVETGKIENNLAAIKSFFDVIIVECCSFKNQVSRLSTENKNFATAISDLKLEISEKSAQYENLVLEKRRLHDYNGSLLKELEEISVKLKIESHEREKQEQGFSKTYGKLNVELVALKLKYEQLLCTCQENEAEQKVLNEEKLDLENQLESWTAKYKDLQSVHESILEELQGLMERFARLSEDNKKNISRWNELKTLYEETKSWCYNLDEHCSDMTEKNAQQFELLQNYETQIKCLGEENNSVNAKLQHIISQGEEKERIWEEKNLDAHRQIEDLSRKCDFMMESNSRVKDQLQKLITENETLIKQTADAREEHRILTGEVENLKMYENKLIHELKLAKESIQLASDENANVNVLISGITAEKEQLSEQISSLNQVIQNQIKEKNNLCSYTTELNEKLQKIEIQFEQMKSTNLSLISDLELKMHELENHVKFNESLKNRVCSLENDVNITTKENEALIYKLNAVQQKVTNTVQQIENSRNENASLKLHNQECSQEIERLQDQIEDITQQKESVMQKLCVTEVELAKSKEELNAVMQDNHNLLEKNVNLFVDIDTINNTKEELEKSNEQLRTQFQKLQEDKTNALNELREMLLYQIDQLQKSNIDLKVENEKLAEINNEKFEYLKEVEKHVRMLTNEMKFLNAKEGSLRQQANKCSEYEFNLKSENVKLDHAVHELGFEQKQFLKQLTDLVSENETLNMEVQSLKKDFEEKESERRELEKIVYLETENIEILKKNEQMLCAEVEELSGQNGRLYSEVDKLISHVEIFDHEKSTDIEKVKTEFGDVLDEKIVKLGRIRMLVEEKKKELDEVYEIERVVKMENEKLKKNLNIVQDENEKMKSRIEELLTQKEELYTVEQMNNAAFQSQMQAIMSRNNYLMDEIEKQKDVKEVLELENQKLEKINNMFEEKIENMTQVYFDQLEKSKIESQDEISKLNNQITEKQNREDSLLKQIETLNVKLVEESHRVSVAQRSHAAQLQKQIEMNKVLEAKLQHYESVERDVLCKRVTELKTNLEEALESNEYFTEDLKCRKRDNEMLMNENENLLVKVEELEKFKNNVESAHKIFQKEKEEVMKHRDILQKKLDSMDLTLKSEVEDKNRIKDEYEIFKSEYKKLVQHKGELDGEFKDAFFQEFKRVSVQLDELKETNSKMIERLKEKELVIKTLTEKLEDLKGKYENNQKKKLNLNETHVVATGDENEFYNTMRQQNLKLLEELNRNKSKILQLEGQVEKEKAEYRNKAVKLHEKIKFKVTEEYEGKLERAKEEYRKIVIKKFEDQVKDWKKKEEELRTMLRKSGEHIKDLSSQLWNKNDQLLRCQQNCGSAFSKDNFVSPNTLKKARSTSNLNVLSMQGNPFGEPDRPLSSLSLMSGNIRSGFVSNTERRLSAMSTMSEDLQLRRKPSLISAKVFPFPSEDEEQEIFDNACLADLKQGKMADDDSVDSKCRLSILQARNSLCPPHLKSSYPAETQFLPPQEFKENDIKMGQALENDCSDIENLLPNEKQKKNRNQAETPRNVLKESTDSNIRRKSFTPKFFNNLFALRGHVTIPIISQQNDENLPVTPKHNRLSSIRRRFTRNSQDLGTTNSGYC